MKRWGILTLVGVSASCGRLGFAPQLSSADAPTDAVGDSRGALQCGPWSAPTAIRVAATAKQERSPMISGDGLTLMWNNSSVEQISQRATRTDPFVVGSAVASLSDISVFDQTFTSDGLEFIYSVTNDPSCPAYTKALAPFQFDQLRQGSPELCALGLTGLALVGDGLTLYSNTRSSGGYGDLFRSTRPAVNAVFSSATMVPGLPSKIGFAAVRSDELELFYETPNPVQVDMYVATRATIAEPWGPPLALPFNDPTASDEDPSITDDATELVFASNRPGAGGYDLYVVTRTCQ